MARITDNKNVLHWGGETVTITRRFLKSGGVRVRVKVTDNRANKVTRDEFRDYADMHVGDGIYARHVSTFERRIASAARQAWNAR